MNLITDALKIFRQNESKTAIINPQGKSITFGELYLQMASYSALLQQNGVTKGTKVYLLVPVSIELYALISAIFALGGIVVFIDPWASKKYVNDALSQVEPDVLLYVSKALPLLWSNQKIRNISIKINLQKIKLNNSPSPITPYEVNEDDSALITFTTGSSGKPKGFDRTHGFLRAQQRAHEKYFAHHSDDIDLCMFPVFVLSNLASGMTSVIADVDLRKIAKAEPLKLIEQIKKYNVTSITCSPALVEPLIQHARDNEVILPSIKQFFTGGAPVNPMLFEKLEPIFPNATMTLVYGSTEAEPIALMDSKDVLQETKTNSVNGKGVVLGNVVDELQCKIIKITDHPLDHVEELPTGEIGEIILSGEFVGKKYYKNPEAFARTKIVENNGTIWHRSGDVGYRNKQEILYMVGRTHNMVNDKNQTIEPLTIEAPIDQIEGVKKSAFFQYDQQAGQSGLAVKLETKYESEKERIKMEIGKFLSNKNIDPAFFAFVNDIPLDSRHNAKIDYHKLQEIFSRESIEKLRNQSLAKRMISYTNERLPIIPVLLLSALFAINAFLFAEKIFAGNIQNIFFNKFAAIASIFLTFFQLRIMDEFKDYEEDKEAYPERILSRGIIKLSDLKKLLFPVIAIQLFLNIFTSSTQLILWAMIFIYSVLMFKEFFIRDILKKTMMGYLISHQLILPIMVLYCFSSIIPDVLNLKMLQTPAILAIIMISIPSTIYEIARKCWNPEREKPTADSYTRFWGISRTSLFVILLVAIFFVATWLNTSPLKMNQIFTTILYLVMAVLLSSTLLFWKKPSLKNSKMVELGGSLILLLGHLLIILANIY